MTREEFAVRLERHDWYYMMSDDGGVYQRGQKDHNEIVAIAKTSPEFAKMYDDKWFDYFGAPHFNKTNTRDKAPLMALETR